MSYRTGPKIVTDGLVLCLDAGDRNSYPGTGSTWGDLSGNGYNNTLINSPSFNVSNGGNIIFDGANDYSQITSSSTLNGITDVSAGCWINIISSGTAGNPGGILNRYYNTTGHNGWAMQAVISSNQVAFSFSGRESSAAYFSNTTNYNYELSTWYYVVGTKQGTSWKVYVNGNLKLNNTNGNGTTTFANNTIYFGGYPQFGAQYRSNFKIALCKIYNRALSGDEITQNYNATKGRFGL